MRGMRFSGWRKLLDLLMMKDHEQKADANLHMAQFMNHSVE